MTTGGTSRFPAGKEVGRQSWEVARHALNACSPRAGLTVIDNDHCFFGEPAVVDSMLAQFAAGEPYLKTWERASKLRLPQNALQRRQLQQV